MKLPVLVFLLASCHAVAQGQATVYKTVDDDGVVSFSDVPPTNGAEVEQFDIKTPAVSTTDEYQQNLEAMRETTDRMIEDRREREKHRAEMRELQARIEAQQQPAIDPGRNYSTYIPGWTGGGYYRPGYPPWRPGHRPGPEFPIVRPPLHPVPPGISRPTQNNSQLMRPILSR